MLSYLQRERAVWAALRCAVCLLAGVFTATACTGSDEGEAAARLESCGTADSIRFDIATTRADATYVGNNRFLHGASIGVFAYYTAQTPFGDGTAFQPNFMYNLKVTKQLNQLWTYSPIRYWPNGEDDKLTFWAYHPHNAEGTAVTDNERAGLPLLTFQTAPKSYEQTDLMLSDVVADESHRSGGVTTPVGYQVVFTFRHALAKVVIQVVDQDDNPLDFVATLAGLYDRGTCFSTTTETVNWSGLAKTPVVFSTEGSATDTEHIFLLIPQSLRDGGQDPTLHIAYDYMGAFYVADDVHLNTIDAVKAWEAGKTYTYTYHVSHSGNAIGVNVNPWYQSGMVFSN